MPGANDGELEPANSSAGTVVLKRPVRTSLLTMKRLLGSDARSVTAPPPVALNTSAMRFVKVRSSPAARVMVLSVFVPFASKRLAVTEMLDAVGLKIAMYVVNCAPLKPDVLATTGIVCTSEAKLSFGAAGRLLVCASAVVARSARKKNRFMV